MLDSARIYGVLVTFERPETLAETLGRVSAQTRQFDRLIVVDNGMAQPAESVTKAHASSHRGVEYVSTQANIGPAGGFALGMRDILETASDDDWIFLLDDDDPPFFDDAIEGAARFALEQTARDQRTAGVGISGGRFDPRRGRVVRVGDDEIHGSVPVDHITGGGLPAYRVGSLREVGVMRPELFFGFEELDMGLRLTRAGYKLYADGDAWMERKSVKRQAGLLPPEEVSARRAASTSWRAGEPSWRRYYSLRNLIQILRESGHGLAAARVSLTRGVLKPLANLLVSPRRAIVSLRLGWRAVYDGWAGRTGRTLEPGTVGGDG
jgi:GT2 family glycosyltransferase